ncbi:hypothetical protein Aduo_001723 [Ancylostoma duodenale]
MLYWLLEAVATFASMDVADLILYVALKVCLIEVLRVKMAEHDSKVRNTISANVVSPYCCDITSTELAMDVTQRGDEEVEFPRSTRNRWKKVTMSNVSDRKIMWSLRSNMVNTLSAMPTAGVLGAGEQDKIHFEVSDSSEKEGKVEFSYGYVDDSIEQFNRRTYSSLKKKVHRLDVVFQ